MKKSIFSVRQIHPATAIAHAMKEAVATGAVSAPCEAVKVERQGRGALVNAYNGLTVAVFAKYDDAIAAVTNASDRLFRAVYKRTRVAA